MKHLPVFPHHLMSPISLIMAEDGVFEDDTRSAPVEHIQLTSSANSYVPDQNRL